MHYQQYFANIAIFIFILKNAYRLIYYFFSYICIYNQ